MNLSHDKSRLQRLERLLSMPIDKRQVTLWDTSVIA